MTEVSAIGIIAVAAILLVIFAIDW